MQLWIHWAMLDNDMTTQETGDEKEKHLLCNFPSGFHQVDAIMGLLSQIISLLVRLCHGSLTIGFGSAS